MGWEGGGAAALCVIDSVRTHRDACATILNNQYTAPVRLCKERGRENGCRLHGDRARRCVPHP